MYAELKKRGIEYVEISTLNAYCKAYEDDIELLQAENSRLRRKRCKEEEKEKKKRKLWNSGSAAQCKEEEKEKAQASCG